MLLITVAAAAVTPVKRWGQLQVIGNQLCDSRGEPVVLRGVSLGWHNLWPRFYNAKCVKWLRDDCTVPCCVRQWVYALKTTTRKTRNLHCRA